jgi:hypothetical protein
MASARTDDEIEAPQQRVQHRGNAGQISRKRGCNAPGHKISGKVDEEHERDLNGEFVDGFGHGDLALILELVDDHRAVHVAGLCLFDPSLRIEPVENDHTDDARAQKARRRQ